jgi:TRAP-type C4-dicarboxylate transport system permease small subunit
MMGIAAAILIIDMLAVTIDVLLRYSLGITYNGLFEIMEYTLLWMTFLPTAWLLKIDGHIKVDLLIERLAPRQKAMLNIVTSIICAILLCALAWYGARLTVLDAQTGLYLSTVLTPVKWPIEIIIPIGYLLLLIELLRKTYNYILTWRSMSGGEVEQPETPPGGES